MRETNGITLIALIITIIVILILVGVVVRISITSGLFGHAGNAVNK
jgi:Tfp pilus assembly protein PilE